MVNQSRKAGLGRTLQRVQRVTNRRKNPRIKDTDKHTLDDTFAPTSTRPDLKSVIAQTNLDEFLEEAQLAGKQFVTERRNVAIINDVDKTRTEMYGDHERAAVKALSEFEDDNENTLTVPRRPHWDSNTTPDQLDEMEKLSFLAWRKKLARLQENASLTLTPFEKNLEVWRQLWRVVERSDIVVQILDSRNPLLYLCDDLIKYVNEEFNGRKLNLILLNKADFLTTEQRRMWLSYFKERNIKVMFFSALYENENINKNFNKKEDKQENGTHEDDDSAESSEIENDQENDDNSSEESAVASRLESNLNINKDTQGDEESEYRIYNKYELIDTWRDILHELGVQREERCNRDAEQVLGAKDSRSRQTSEVESDQSHGRPLTVGLVGYPNVGKSSTINALLSAKRVAVSATPGKTKHFQTFFIDRDMMLCDCPGLVFPNTVSSKSEMVTNGILLIDQMKDCIGPVRLIVEHVPRGFFEDIYGLAFEHDAKQNITAEDLLNAFGFMRGYMTSRGLPDVSRAARKICKDYINGRILYCSPPPNVDRKAYHDCSKLAEAMRQIEAKMADPNYALKITERQSRLMRQAKGTDISSRDFDAQYFRERSEGFHIKGLPGIGNLTQPVGKPSDIKSSKQDRKHKKKEKLRRVYRYLDE